MPILRVVRGYPTIIARLSDQFFTRRIDEQEDVVRAHIMAIEISEGLGRGGSLGSVCHAVSI